MNIYYFNITVLRNRNVFGEVVKTLDDARAEKISMWLRQMFEVLKHEF